jgi:predicted dehydrogenase
MSRIPLGVGVIGLGVGEQHLRTFAGHPDCRIAAICDLDAARLEALGQEFPGARRYTSAEELIQDADVHIVSIASNDDDHARQILLALSCGKHVFAEKPLCLNQQDLHAIVRAWRRAGNLRLSTNTVLRRSPRFRWLKEAITAGKLGTLFCIEGDYVYGRLPKLIGGWRGRIPGYSVTLGGGIHIVDLVLWLSGQRPVEVIACGSSLGSAGSEFNGTDLVVALLRFQSGLIAKVSANFASVYAHFHRFMVYGTAATFENLPEAISSSARLWQARDGGAPPIAIDAQYPAVSKGALIPAFVDGVLGRGTPDVTEQEVFAGVAICLAIDQAVVLRRPVSIDYQFQDSEIGVI